MQNYNFILNVDSYKTGHFLQLPPNTQYVSSYIESRGSERGWKETVFFGLQMFLKELEANPITMTDVAEAEELFKAHGVPFNYEGWKYIVYEYGGKLPISIKAVPEGTIVPTSNVLVQLRNTDPKVPWLTSYVETALLRSVWYPTTVATQSWRIKKLLKEYLVETSDKNADEEVMFKLHDFGSRGVSSRESAGIGGVAHLVNFMGTDTVEAIVYARKYYDEPMAGFSIPAAEHSTITAWGGPEKEVDAYRNMIKQFAKPGAIVAIVGDSYDMYNAADNIFGGVLKEEIIASGATIVVRPDSGDPVDVTLEVAELLMDNYGYTTNSKGFRVLPDCIRIIQGDGVNETSIERILLTYEQAGISTENIAFGMGGALLQSYTRDTLKFAMKASAIREDGVWRDVYKDPLTDPGKKSKPGRLALVDTSRGLKTVREEDAAIDKLQEVFYNGKVQNVQTLSGIRDRSSR